MTGFFKAPQRFEFDSILETKPTLPNKFTVIQHRFIKAIRRSFQDVSFRTSLRLTLMIATFLVVLLLAEQVQFAFVLRDCNWPFTYSSQESYDKVMIITDVHVLGNLEAPWPLLHDTDHYLSSFFSYILAKYNPATILVLGDLIHEGYYSKTSDFQFSNYASRFDTAIRSKIQNRNLLMTMGNHDAGDQLSQKSTKIDRWQFHFGNSTYLKTINGVNYQVINSQTVKDTYLNSKVLTFSSDPICLLHYPLFQIEPIELRRSIKQNCRYIFTGHEHLFNSFGKEAMIPTFSPNRIEGDPGFVLASIGSQNLSYSLCKGPNRNTFYFILLLVWLLSLYKFINNPSKLFHRTLLISLAILLIVYPICLYLNLGQVFIPVTYAIGSTCWIAAFGFRKWIFWIVFSANIASVVFSMGLLQKFDFSFSKNIE